MDSHVDGPAALGPAPLAGLPTAATRATSLSVASAQSGVPPTLGRVPEPDQTLSAPADDPSAGRAPFALVVAGVGWIAGMFGGAITSGIVFAVASSGADDFEFEDLSLGWIAVGQLGLWIGLLGGPWFYARWTGNGMRREFGLRATLSDVWVGGLWGLLGQFGILWIVYLPMQWLTDVTREELSEPARDMTERASDPVGVVLLILIVGVGAPIVEEIFYRGLLQRSLVRLTSVPVGIGIASLIFGVVHFQLLQLPALALAGVLFGVLAHRAGRLGPAIMAHLVFNMTAVVVLLLAES